MLSSLDARTAERGPGEPVDEGVTLIEVVVAFVVLMIALIPLSYLFTTSVIQAGQSNNQQTALSIAEQWVETLSNVTSAGQQQRRGHRRHTAPSGAPVHGAGPPAARHRPPINGDLTTVRQRGRPVTHHRLSRWSSDLHTSPPAVLPGPSRQHR